MRLGVLDVGSNTIHLQVVDTHPGARPNPTFNHKEELSLTEYLTEENRISEEGIAALRLAIKNAVAHSKNVKTEELLPFATSALREAANGTEIIAAINKDYEIDLQVLTGEEEAKLTFLAARRWFGWSSGRLLVIDIGGGSLEIASGDDEPFSNHHTIELYEAIPNARLAIVPGTSHFVVKEKSKLVQDLIKDFYKNLDFPITTWPRLRKEQTEKLN